MIELPLINNSPIDIVIVTFFRPKLAERTITAIKENTRWPHRLIIEDNTPYVDDEIQRKLSAGMNRGFAKVESRQVILTCDDVLPPLYPEGTPCWLERLIKISTMNPHYGGINCRFQKMANYHFNDSLEKPQLIYRHGRSLSNVFRISWSDDLRKIGKKTGYCVPGMTRKYESSQFAGHMQGIIKKRIGCAAHIHCNHLGHQEENKGYPTDVPFEFNRMPGRAYCDVDPLTHIPVGHTCPEFDWNDLESLRVDTVEEIAKVLEESNAA